MFNVVFQHISMICNDQIRISDITHYHKTLSYPLLRTLKAKKPILDFINDYCQCSYLTVSLSLTSFSQDQPEVL